MAYKFDCRFFNGYKPCQFKRSCEGCNEYKPIGKRIAIVSLEALGAVLRSTCLLEPIKKKYETCHITWITMKNAVPLLQNNPYIDSLLPYDGTTSDLLRHLTFDIIFGVDKSQQAGGLVEIMNGREKFGFGLTPQGVIRPLSSHADYQFDVGLNDHLKFYEKQKTETQQITETMNLTWERAPYILDLSEEEQAEMHRRRASILSCGAKGIIGYNTGCSLLFP